jgi:hypothetical protein
LRAAQRQLLGGGLRPASDASPQGVRGQSPRANA